MRKQDNGPSGTGQQSPPTWKSILKINGEFLRAAAGFGGAWVFWQLAGPGFELFRIFAVLFAIAGAKRLILGLYGAVKLILRTRKWARYQAQGVAPKADPMASRDDLRKRGLIK